MTRQRHLEWFRCVTPWAVFAIVAKDGIVVTAPPIASWSVGKPLATMGAYLRRHDGSATRMLSALSAEMNQRRYLEAV